MRPAICRRRPVALDRLRVRRRGRSASPGGRRGRASRRRSCRRRRRRRRRWTGRTRSWQVPGPSGTIILPRRRARGRAGRRGGYFCAGASSSRQGAGNCVARTPTPPEQCQVTVPSALSSGAKTSAPRGLSTVRTMLSASSESWLPSASVAGRPAASSDAGGSLRSAYQAASAWRAGSLLA